MNQDALMMEFRDESAARLAAETFEELGYEPCGHGGGRLHIHVRDEDLTSALEIMQSHGGQIVEHAQTETAALMQEAYGLDTIPIPAHTVNEDWVDEYSTSEPGAEAVEELLADDASYDRFDA